MDETKGHTEFIKNALAAGKKKEEIFKELLGQGLTVDAIQEAFEEVDAKEEKEDTKKRTIRIVVSLGALLVAAGIFSFIASNWQELGRASKVAIIIVAMLIVYYLGWHFTEKKGFVRTGYALYLLGTFIFGGGIFLVAQIFNVRANWPDGFILWMIGAIAMGFAVESYLIFTLAIMTGLVAITGAPLWIFQGFGDLFLSTSLKILILATLATFWAGYKIRKNLPPDQKNYY